MSQDKSSTLKDVGWGPSLLHWPLPTPEWTVSPLMECPKQFQPGHMRCSAVENPLTASSTAEPDHSFPDLPDGPLGSGMEAFTLVDSLTPPHTSATPQANPQLGYYSVKDTHLSHPSAHLPFPKHRHQMLLGGGTEILRPHPMDITLLTPLALPILELQPGLRSRWVAPSIELRHKPASLCHPAVVHEVSTNSIKT